MKQVDVLNLEWSSEGRDREVASMVCFALRKMGYSVVEKSIFNYKHYFKTLKPRLFFTVGSIGAPINVLAVKFAKGIGMPVVTLFAEGNFTEHFLEYYLWGHNKDKVIFEDLQCQWTARTRRLTVNAHPRFKEKIKVSGAAGFDSYSIYSFLNRDQFLKKYKKPTYKKLIGIAGWVFDKMNPSYLYYDEVVANYGLKQVERYKRDAEKIKETWKALIESNPDVAFLLKEHPGVLDNKDSEFAHLKGNPNVIYIRKEESIGDCINPCDMWIGFDSTTCLEAWLLKKPTFLVNPSGIDFPRTGIHRGSPIVQTKEEAVNVVKETLASEKLPGFDQLAPERERIIKETIQWKDGKNHMRAAYFINKVLSVTKKNPHYSYPFMDKFYTVIQNAQFQLAYHMPFLPARHAYRHAHRIFKQRQLNALTQKRSLDLEQFHQKNQLTASDIEEVEKLST